jgi:GDPmannose 4,6-dehydratase
MKKKALITGITGQDGSYLAELLLEKDYTILGLNRRSSTLNTSRIDHLLKESPGKKNNKIYLAYGDMTDSISLKNIITNFMPDEIYNLAAQSHVGVSFEAPEYTTNTIALGTLRLLEIVRILSTRKKIKFYNASTSEIFGNSSKGFQNEMTPFYPQSPYGVAKLYSHWITVNYRNSYGLFACNGILFNHESPRRGQTFVTKKIISSLVKIKHGLQKKLFLGNIYSKRDWGHAKDYVKMQWKMLQQKKAEDFVIATGKQLSIKNFINIVCKKLNIKITWKENGIDEHAMWNNKKIIEIDERFFRPGEVNQLKGDSRKAKKKLQWKPQYSLNKLIDEMIKYETDSIKSNNKFLNNYSIKKLKE